jgi:hypothetical protein
MDTARAGAAGARASAGEGDHPDCTPLERSGMAEVWGYPCARERSDGPLPLPGAAPPLKPPRRSGLGRQTQKTGRKAICPKEGRFGIIDDVPKFQRSGQPSITKCQSVRPYISSYAEANCLLSNGKVIEILTLVVTKNASIRLV